MNVRETLQSALTGRYQIDREIGAGGMATVYVARDLRHDRQVALKVLRPELGAILGVERFLAEIRVTANLQHPHLLPLFDSGEAGGLLFYVMPYVPGESLRVRLDRERQLGIEEAIRITVAVTSALDYAHRNGVVHRDLKPENILLQDGEPMVSDFGIALAVSNAGGARITQTGLSLGTPAYMSPEQAAGDRVVDARSDVYSLGAVLYEMLIGEPPHTGANIQQVISRILTEVPRGVSEQRPTVPDTVDDAVHRALAKLPADRFPTARDFGEALRATSAPTGATRALRRTSAPGVTTRQASANVWKGVVPWAIAALATAAAVVASLRRPAPNGATTPLVRFSLTPPGGLRSEFAELALSADGRRLLVADGPIGARRVWIRSLGEDDITELPQLLGTQAQFLSPTGSAVGYVADGRIRTVPIGGGESTVVATVGDGPYFESPSWGSSGVIVFARSDSSGLWAVDAVGGTASRVTSPDSSRGENDGSPSFLPDGRRFVFERRSRGAEPAIMVGARDEPARALGVSGSTPRFAADRLLYQASDGTISSIAVEAASLKPLGVAVPLFTLASVRGPRRGGFAASSSGVLSFVEAAPRLSRVVAVSRTGEVTPLVSTLRSYGTPAASPDGRRVAVEVMEEGGSSDIWIFDAGGTSGRLTRGGRNQSPVWSPRGDAIAYGAQAGDGEKSHLMLQRLNAAVAAQDLFQSDGFLRPLSFSPAGDSVRAVVLAIRSAPRMVSVSVGDHGSTAYAAVQGERGGSLSPSGQWFVYAGTEEARTEVFVRPSAALNPVVRISLAGGEQPRWSRDGKFIYYRDSTSLLEVGLTLTPQLRVTSRRTVFRDAFERGGPGSYDIGSSGQLVMLQAEDPKNHVDVVANLATLIAARTLAASRAAAGR